MESSTQKALSAAVARLLKPLVRILLQNGMPHGVFSEIAKGVYVEVAEQHFGIEGRKQSISRISILTGLTRKEVQRLTQENPQISDRAAVERYNRAARVISGWIRDKRFVDKQGQPAALKFEQGKNSFATLVKEYSGDIPPRALLDELLRVGAVERGQKDCITLRARAYLPSTGAEDKIAILGTDVGELIAAIEHNLSHAGDEALFQRKVAYDNLPEEALGRIRKLSAGRAQRLLESMDKEMSQQDRDINPDTKGTGRKRAVLGIYYFEEDFDGEN